jgi:hypothetical protein
MAHTIYDNFFLSNTVEDQFNSHLNLVPFCTIDNTLEGTAGMKRLIHTYRATNGTEKLTVGQGNSKSIEVSYTPVEYEIALAQNRFVWRDEDAMKDPMIVPVGLKHGATDMFNTVQGDVYGEFAKTGLEVPVTTPDFDAFVDASAALNLENLGDVSVFAFVCPKDKAKVRKALKDDLKYVEQYAKNGYIGTVAGINLYTKQDATEGEIIVATKEAVTIFNKKGVEVEVIGQGTRSETAANVRENTAFSRKYYVVALTDESKAVKIKIGA